MRVEEIRRLIKLVEESHINELEVRRWWTRVRILKRSPHPSGENGQTVVLAPAAASAPPPTPPPVATEAIAAQPVTSASTPQSVPETAAEEGLVAINSPMVGTFYRAPSPGAPPYVEVNQHVETGQVICIVEAMKLMNEIEAEVSGTVQRALVENSQPVEFNQPLFLVKPD